jgi:ParB-like chromosome segregation protein Spo0J
MTASVPPPPFQIMPPLSEVEREALAESIREYGVRVPVVVDENGEIIDGHHRATIAAELGIEYATTSTERGLADHDKRILAVRLNTNRRQLSDAQRLAVAEAIRPAFEERARLRQTELGRTHGEADPLDAIASKGKSADEIAAAVGLGSGDTLQRKRKEIKRARDVLGGEYVDEKVAKGATVKEPKREAREKEGAKTVRGAQPPEPATPAPVDPSIIGPDNSASDAAPAPTSADAPDPAFGRVLDILRRMLGWSDGHATGDGLVNALAIACQRLSPAERKDVAAVAADWAEGLRALAAGLVAEGTVR